MKVNEIRKLAKEIRTSNCKLGYDEAVAVFNEMNDYVNSEVADGWTDRTKKAIASDMEDIKAYISLVAPEEEEPVVDERIEETEEIVRKNFKTVVAEMAGKKYPILEAVRWFATVYARDGYEKFKCVKGMLSRRGYELVEFESGVSVMNMERNKAVAFVENKDGVVVRFSIEED